MQFASTGGIFLRLDSSGNLTVFDTSGNVINKWISGKLSTVGNVAKVLSSSTVSTASLSVLSTGVGIGFTPQVATSALVFFGGNELLNNTSGDIISVVLHRNTSGIPALNASPSGTGDTLLAGGAGPIFVTAAASQGSGGMYAFYDSSLTVGTQYFYYVCYQALGGGTVSLVGPFVTVIEL